MASNSSRGALAKRKTKKWLEGQGYVVAYLEMVRWVPRGTARIPVKIDQWGCDLIAISAAETLHVQVKSGAMARTGYFPEALRQLGAFPCPPATRKVVIAWPLRARQPRIVEWSPAPAVEF